MKKEFSDILTIINGKNQKAVENPNGAYPIYGSGGIIGYANKFLCPAHTVIIGRKGTINKPIYVDTPFWNVDTAFGLHANESILLPRYLYYFCISYDFERLNKTVTIPSLTKTDLLRIPMEVPSIAEQRKICTELDRIETLEKICRASLETLDQLVKSQFVELFGDPHHSTLYPYKRVKDFTEVRSGGTPSRKQESYWKDGDVRWVKTTELRNNEIYDTEEKITTEAVEHSSAKIVPQDTILIAMYGQGKTRGMTAYLKVESTTNQACACILPTEGINPKYLWRFFILSYEELRNLAQGAGQPNLTGDMIKNFSVLMPPLALQNEFAAFVEQVDKSELVLRQLLEKQCTLKAALMQEYFAAK